jgi:RES domain-containing protein
VDGSRAGGRWALPGSFPVIYLGRPPDSVVVEAYRHLIDDIEGMTPERVRGRYLIRAQVCVRDVVDLRDPSARLALGLGDDAISSDVGDYDACQRIGHVAHQLNRHGILAPAATGFGETLALFVDFLSPAELPQRIGEPTAWRALPADPRRLRLHDPNEAVP